MWDGSPCWHSPRFTTPLLMHREPKISYLLLLVRVGEWVASFPLLQDFFCRISYRSPSWPEWGFTGRFLRKHVLKTIWSDPAPGELLTESPCGWQGLSIQGPELLNGICLLSNTLVSSSRRHMSGLTLPYTCQCSCQFHAWESAKAG